jgi:hypothetical protein
MFLRCFHLILQSQPGQNIISGVDQLEAEAPRTRSCMRLDNQRRLVAFVRNADAAPAMRSVIWGTSCQLHV